MSPIVTALQLEDFEASLARVSAGSAGALEGVFGPGSLTWRVNREAALFLGAGRALLFQLAHPWVAQAIADHSTTLADPIGRFHRTFDVMFSLVFGSLDQALAAARRLHLRHAGIAGRLTHDAGKFAAGSPYVANEAAALLWVHATLVDTALRAHDLVLPPLSAADRARYYDESRTMAALFAVPADIVPADWPAFKAYMSTMLGSDTLAVTPQSRAIAEALLFRGAKPWLRSPRWYCALTASLLPTRLREGFGLGLKPAEAETATRAIDRLGRAYSAFPERLRTVGPYQEAMDRLAGREHPRILTRAANRLWIGRGALAVRGSGLRSSTAQDDL